MLRHVGSTALAAGCFAMVLAACAAAPTLAMQQDTATRDAATRDPGAATYGARCASCHELVPPHAYSDAQWRGIIARMQTQADLTDTQAEDVLCWLLAHNDE